MIHGSGFVFQRKVTELISRKSWGLRELVKVKKLYSEYVEQVSQVLE